MTAHQDNDSFRQFVMAQWGPLTPYGVPAHRRPGTAEDLVQSALEKTHRHRHRVLRKDAPAATSRRHLPPPPPGAAGVPPLAADTAAVGRAAR